MNPCKSVSEIRDSIQKTLHLSVMHLILARPIRCSLPIPFSGVLFVDIAGADGIYKL